MLSELAAGGHCRPCRPPELQRDPGQSQARAARSARGQDGTGADHIAVTEAAIAALPPAYRRNLMITWDAFTGAAADDLNGWDITAAVAEVQPGQP
jgi:hypothetical protein